MFEGEVSGGTPHVIAMSEYASSTAPHQPAQRTTKVGWVYSRVVTRITEELAKSAAMLDLLPRFDL